MIDSPLAWHKNCLIPTEEAPAEGMSGVMGLLAVPQRNVHPEPAAYAKKFSGKYEHRLITGGIGHNLPQEAPQAFAEAVVDVAES